MDNNFLGIKRCWTMLGLLHTNGLVLTIKNDLHYFLSCEMLFLEDKKKSLLGQQYPIKKLKQAWRTSSTDAKMKNSRMSFFYS